MKEGHRAWRAGLLVLAALPFLGAVAWAVQELTVIEREAAIRKDKRNYSPRLAVVKEGDRVVLKEEPQDEEDPWLRVEYKGLEGWMNRSSVTDDPKVVLSGSAVARGARATEQDAARRGFNPEVEKEYRKDNPNLDGAYRFLDEVEKKKVPEDRILDFLRVGKLIEEGGAQ